MEGLTEKQKDCIAVGKRMKEIIELSKNLTLKGDPVIAAWMKDVEKVFMKHINNYPTLKKIWNFEVLPSKSYLFDTLTELRRVLKDEGVFSKDFVE